MAGSRTLTLCRHLPDSAASVSDPASLPNQGKPDVSCRLSFHSPVTAAATSSNPVRYPHPYDYDLRRDSQISTEQEYIDIPEGVAARPAASETENARSLQDSNASVMYKKEGDGCGSPSRVPVPQTWLHLRDAATRSVGRKYSGRKKQKALAPSKEVPACPRSLLSFSCPSLADDAASSRFRKEHQAREEMDRSARGQQRLASAKQQQQQNTCQLQKPPHTQEQLLQTRGNGVRHSHVKCLKPCMYPVDCSSRTKENLGSVVMPLSEDAARASVPVAFSTTRRADVKTSPLAMVEGTTTRTKQVARDESTASAREEGSTGEASRAATKASGRKNKVEPFTRAKGDRNSKASCATDAAASACLRPAHNIQTSHASPQTRHAPADMTSSQVLSAPGKEANFFSPLVSSTPSTSFMSLSSSVPDSAGQVSRLRPLQPRPTFSPRTLDGRSLLPRAAASGDICGASLSGYTVAGSCFFSSGFLSKNLPRRAANDLKIFSLRVQHQPPSVERLPLFRKLIEEAEHAHWERRQQKLQVIRQQQQQLAYVRQLMQQHARERSSISSTYDTHIGCGFAANSSRMEDDGLASGRKCMPHRESTTRRRCIINAHGVTTGADRATDGCVSAASRPPTFSTLRHVIRARAASRAARAEQQRQPTHELVPTDREYKYMRKRRNSCSRDSASSGPSSRTKPCRTDRRAAKQQFRVKKSKEHGDSGHMSAASCSYSAEATTGCSSSRSKHSDFSQSISSSAASGGFHLFESSETEEGSSSRTGHQVCLSRRGSPSGNCRSNVKSDTLFTLSPPSSTARGNSWLRFPSSGKSSYVSKAYLRRGSRVGLAAGARTPRTCSASVSARRTFIKGREGRRAASATAADETRKNNEPTFTVESSTVDHTCKVAMPSSLAEQAFPVSGRPTEEEKVSVARINLAAYVKYLSNSGRSNSGSDRAWGQKKWPSHTEKQEIKRKTKQQLLSSSARCSGSVSSDASCNSCPRTHDHACQRSKRFNDNLFRCLHGLQQQEELPLEQWQQHQEQLQAEQKRSEKNCLAFSSGKERGLCLLSGERKNSGEIKHGRAENDLCSTHSRSVPDSVEQSRESQQPVSAAAEEVIRVEAAGARDTDHFSAGERAKTSTPPLETMNGRAGVATLSSFLSQPTPGGLVAGRKATPPARIRKHIGREMLNAFGQSRCLYTRADPLIRMELSLRASTAVALEQEKVDVSKERQQPRRPPYENLLQSFHEQPLERFPEHPLQHNGVTEVVADQPCLRPDFSGSDAKSSPAKDEQRTLNKRRSAQRLGKGKSSQRSWMAASEDMSLPSAEDSVPQDDDSPFVTRLYSLREAALAAGTQSGSVTAATAAPHDFLLGSIAKDPIWKRSFVDRAAVSQSNAGAAQSAAAVATVGGGGGAGEKSSLSAAAALEEMCTPLMSGAVSVESPASFVHVPDVLPISPTISAAAAAAIHVTAGVPSKIAPLPTDDLGTYECNRAFPSPSLLPGGASVAAPTATSSADTRRPSFAASSPALKIPSPGDSSVSSLRLSGDAAQAGFSVAPLLRAAERELRVLHTGREKSEVSANVSSSSSSSNTVTNNSSSRAGADSFVHSVNAGEAEKGLKSISPLYAPRSAARAATAAPAVGKNARDAREGRQYLFSLTTKDRKGVISERNDSHCSSSSSSRSNSRSRCDMSTWDIDNERCCSSTRSMSNAGRGEQFKMERSRDGSVKRRSTTATATRGYVLLVSHEGSTPEGKSDSVERSGMPLRVCLSPVDAEYYSEQTRRNDMYIPVAVPAAAGAATDNRTISARPEPVVGRRLSSLGDPGYHSESTAQEEIATSDVIRDRLFQGGGTCFTRKTGSSVSQVKEDLCPQTERENCCSDVFRHIITKAREYRNDVALLAKRHQAAASQTNNREGVHSEHACRIEFAEGDALKPHGRQSTLRTTVSGEGVAAAVPATTHAEVWTATAVDKAADAGEAASPALHSCPHLTTVLLETAARTAAPDGAAALPLSAVAAKANAVAAVFQGVPASPAAPSEGIAATASAKAGPTSNAFNTPSAARATAARAGSPVVAAAPTCAAMPLAARVESALRTADLRVGTEREENIQASVPVASVEHEGIYAAHSKSQLSCATRSCSSSEQEDVSRSKLDKGKHEEEETQKSRTSRENETTKFAIIVQNNSDTRGHGSSKPTAVAGEIIVASSNSAATHTDTSSGSNYQFCEDCSFAFYPYASAEHIVPDNNASSGPITTAPAMPTAAGGGNGIAIAAGAFSCGDRVDVGCDFFASQQTSTDARPPAHIPVGSSSSLRIQRDVHVASGAAVSKTDSGVALATSPASLLYTRQRICTAVDGPFLAVASAAPPVDADNCEDVPRPSVKIVSCTCPHFQKHLQPMQHQDFKQQRAPQQELQQWLCIGKQSSPQEEESSLVQQYSKQQAQRHQHPQQQIQQEQPNSTQCVAQQQRQPERQVQSLLCQRRCMHQPSKEQVVGLEQFRPQQLYEVQQQPEAQKCGADDVYYPFVMRAALSDSLTATQVSTSLFLCSNCSSRSDRSRNSVVTTAAATPSTEVLIPSRPSSALHSGLKDRTSAAASGSPGVPAECGSRSVCGTALATGDEPLASIASAVAGSAPIAPSSERKELVDRSLLDSSPTIPAPRGHQQQVTERATQKPTDKTASPAAEGVGTAVVATAPTAKTAALLPEKALGTAQEVSQLVSVPLAEEAARMTHEQNEREHSSLIANRNEAKSAFAGNAKTDNLMISTSLTSLSSLGGSYYTEESRLTQVLRHLLLLLQQPPRRSMDRPSSPATEEDIQEECLVGEETTAAAADALTDKIAACATAAAVSSTAGASPFTGSSSSAHGKIPGRHYCAEAGATYTPLADGVHLPTSTGHSAGGPQGNNNKRMSPVVITNGSDSGRPDSPSQTNSGKLDAVSKSSNRGEWSPAVTGSHSGSNSSVALEGNSTGLTTVRVRPSSPPPRPGSAIVSAAADLATRDPAATHRVAEVAASMVTSPAEAPDAAALAIVHTAGAAASRATGEKPALTRGEAETATQISAAKAATPIFLMATPDVADMCTQRAITGGSASASPTPLSKEGGQAGEKSGQNGLAAGASKVPQAQALDLDSVRSSNYNIGSIMHTVTAQQSRSWLPTSRRCPQFAAAAAARRTNALKADFSKESRGIRAAEEAAAAGEYGGVQASGELLHAANATGDTGPVAGQVPNEGESKSYDISSRHSAGGAEEEQLTTARAGECDDVSSKSETLRPLLLASLLGMLSLNESMLRPLLPTCKVKDRLVNCTGTSGGTNYDKTNMVFRSLSGDNGSGNRGELSTGQPEGESCAHKSIPGSLALSAVSDAVPVGGASEWMKTLPPDLQQAAALSISLLRQWSTSTALSYSASPLASLQDHTQQRLQQPQGPEDLRVQQQWLPVQSQNQLLATEEYSRQQPCQRVPHQHRRMNPNGSTEEAQQPNKAGKLFGIGPVLERQHKRTTLSSAAAAASTPIVAKPCNVASLDNLPEAAVLCSAFSSGASVATLGSAAATGTPVYSAAAGALNCTLQGEKRSLSLSQLQQASFSGSLSLQGLEEQRLQPQQQQQDEEQKRLQLQQHTQEKKPELQPSQVPKVLPQMGQLIREDRFSPHCAAEQESYCSPATNIGTPQLFEEQRRALAPTCLQQTQEPQQHQRQQLDQQWQREVEQRQECDQQLILQSLKLNKEKKHLQRDDGAVQLERRQCLPQHLQQDCGQHQDRKTQRHFQPHDELRQQLLHRPTPLEPLQRLRAPEAAERQKLPDQWNGYGIACETDEALKITKKKGAGTTEKRKGPRTETTRESSSMRISSDKRHSSKRRKDTSRRRHVSTRRRRGDGNQRGTTSSESISRSTRRRSSGTVVHRKSNSSRFTSRHHVTHWETGAALVEKRKSRTDRCVSESATNRQRLGLSASSRSTDSIMSKSTADMAAKLSLPVGVARVPDACSTAIAAIADTCEYSGSGLDAQNTCVQMGNTVSLKKNKKGGKKLNTRTSRKHCTSVEFDEVNSLNLSGVRLAAAAVEKSFLTSITETETAPAVAQHRHPVVSCMFSKDDGQHSQRLAQQHLDPPSAARQPQPKRCKRPVCTKKQRGLPTCEGDEKLQGKQNPENILLTDASIPSDCSVPCDIPLGGNSTPAEDHNTATHPLRKQSRTEKRGDSTHVNKCTWRKPTGERQNDSTRCRGRSRTQVQRSVSRNRDHPTSSECSSSCMEERNTHDHGSSRLNQVTSRYRETSYNQRDDRGHRSFRARLTPKASVVATSISGRSDRADEQVLPMLRKHLQQQRELQEELEQIEQQLAGLHLLNSRTTFSGSVSGAAATVAPAETDVRLDDAVVSCNKNKQKRYADLRKTGDGNTDALSHGSSGNHVGDSRTDDRKNKSWSNISGSTAYWTPLSASMISASLGERGQVMVSSRVRQSRSRDDVHLVAAEVDTADSCAFPARVVSTARVCHAKIRSISKTSSRSAGSDRSDSCERIMGKELLQLSGGKVGGLVAVKQQLLEACRAPQGDFCNGEDTSYKHELSEETECRWRSGAGFATATSPWEILPLHRPLYVRQAFGGNRFLASSVKGHAVKGTIQARVSRTQAAITGSVKQRRLSSRGLQGSAKQSQRFKDEETSRRRSSDSPAFLCKNGRSGWLYCSKEICADELTHRLRSVANHARASGTRKSCQPTGSRKASILTDSMGRASGTTAIIPQALNQQHTRRRSRQQRPQHSQRPERNLQTSMLFDSETDDARDESEQTPSHCES